MRRAVQQLRKAASSGLHRKVANAIELRATSRFSEVAETLAYHFSCSDQYAKAFQYLSLSGQKCLDIYSLEEAEHNFRKALEFLDLAPNCADDQAMATVMANLLQVLYLRGDLLSLRDAAERYIPRLQAFGDTPQLVFALYFHCMLLEHFCEFRLAEGKAHRARHRPTGRRCPGASLRPFSVVFLFDGSRPLFTRCCRA